MAEGLRRCGQLSLVLSLYGFRWCWCGVDGFAVDDGAQDFGVEELLGRGGGDVAVEDDEVGEVAGLEAALYSFRGIRRRRRPGCRRRSLR